MNWFDVRDFIVLYGGIPLFIISVILSIRALIKHQKIAILYILLALGALVWAGYMASVVYLVLSETM